MDVADQLIRIFCDIDEFCKEFDTYAKHKLLSDPSKSPRGPSCQLALSEIMTLLVMFHFIRFRDFKTFYIGHVETYWHSYFPKLPSYNRFIELIPRAIFPQRGTIETVINHLKHFYQVWHTRHRSMINAMTHLISALAAYAIEPLKLSAIKLLGVPEISRMDSR